MCKFTKILGASFGCVFVLSTMIAANAVESPRAAAGNFGRNAQVARMPSVPVLPVDATGNVAPSTGPQNPDDPDKPDPKPECPDGGVRNSEYTSVDCMNDVLMCINNGALPGGLNDLFNEDMRNDIENGMDLCASQVSYCMVTVRRDCKPVYRAIADVWVDFNSRKIQPEYYNFVLRKTGLTPNQAENTCRLLDKNTYGSSFTAVANSGKTTDEYDQNVGAYNRQMGNVLIKSNPVGAQVNDGNPGVDGERGHYARWDATTATCYVRVAAYNKDKQIKNSWLFGALGNDKLAEVWRATGETFTCNKNLFGFSLMNDTSTAAVVGIGGGTLLGAGVGAIAGHGARDFNCGNASALKELNKELRQDIYARTTLRKYVPSITASDIDVAQCNEILDLYYGLRDGELCPTKYSCEIGFNDGKDHTVAEANYITAEVCENGKAPTKYDCQTLLVQRDNIEIARCEEFIEDNGSVCSDKHAKNELIAAFSGLEILEGEKSNMLPSIATGAAIGAGTGGVATAITAFVEKNNISCRVGDGLETVAFGKSHSIGSLKDFYVKWNLRLPDTVMPTATAVDCKSWKLSCAQYTDANDCKVAALNYKPDVNGTITLVRSACAVSGSVCIENAAVAASYGACKE